MGDEVQDRKGDQVPILWTSEVPLCLCKQSKLSESPQRVRVSSSMEMTNERIPNTPWLRMERVDDTNLMDII